MTERKRRREYIAIMGGERVENVTRSNGTEFTREFKFDGDPVHMDIANFALAELTAPDGAGYFSKEDALDNIKAAHPYAAYLIDAAVENNKIHWDYIVRWLDEQYGAKLIPLAANFFKRNGGEKPLKDQMREAQDHYEATGDATNLQKIAGRAQASGFGKKTAGWASVRHDNMGLVVVRMKRTAAMAAGFRKSAEVHALKARQFHVPLPNDTVPRIEDTAKGDTDNA